MRIYSIKFFPLPQELDQSSQSGPKSLLSGGLGFDILRCHTREVLCITLPPQLYSTSLSVSQDPLNSPISLATALSKSIQLVSLEWDGRAGLLLHISLQPPHPVLISFLWSSTLPPALFLLCKPSKRSL